MYLGLDLGTSGLKALLVGADGARLAEGTAPLEVSRPRDGWSEQVPDDWIRACRQAVAALGADLAGVRAVGLSGQMHGATFLGADMRPLRPCMLWNDGRAHAEAAALDDAEARAITGNAVFAGFTAPKAEWVRRHEPEVFAATRLILLPKDYLRLWLTGEAATDPSDASGTSWLDVGARDWSEALLARGGLSRAAMPRIVEGSAVSGRLRAEAAAALGLPAGIPVAGGGGDNAASAVGVGAVAPGTGFVSLGTSGVIFAPTQGFRPAPARGIHAFAHALPGAWHHMGVVLACADALAWLARLTGRGARELTEGLGPLRAPGRLAFVPHLGGERTPWNDAGLRGALVGIGHGDGPEAAARAVIEGVCFALAECRDALEGEGARIERLAGIGGGAGSAYWVSALATALGTPITLPEAGASAAALGAARLAMMADGAGIEAAAPAPGREVAPDPHLAAAFAEARARHREVCARVMAMPR